MKNKGFTLIEMIIAIFVITVGLMALVSMMLGSAAASQFASSRLQAAYLAQEGLEIVRNIRDANWLAQRENPEVLWDQNLDTGSFEADFNDLALAPYQNRSLKIDGGFYNYDSGQDTNFQRKITISKPAANVLQVSLQVSWQQRGLPQSLTIEERLYNWR